MAVRAVHAVRPDRGDGRDTEREDLVVGGLDADGNSLATVEVRS